MNPAYSWVMGMCLKLKALIDDHPFMVQMKAGGFNQIVKDVTHDGGNILDVVFINQYVNSGDICLYQKPVIFSDHDILFLSIKDDK